MGEEMSRWRKSGLARHLLTWFLRSYARALPSMEVESERMSCGGKKHVTENECNDRINDTVNEISPFLKITRAVSSGAAASRAAQAESRRKAGGHVASQKSV